MELQVKKERLINALTELNIIETFRVEDNEKYTFLQSYQPMKDGRCLVSLELNESIYNMIHYFMGTLKNEENEGRLRELLNELNKENLIIKYYLDTNNHIMARVTYLAFAEKFDEKLFVSMMTQCFTNITNNHYDKIIELL